MKRNIREILKEKDIKITELADYLGITRPTLYKFIDIFDSGNRKGIDSKTLKVFLFIDKHPLRSKAQIVSYIINLTNESSPNDESNNERELDNIEASVLDYLREVNSLLNKKKINEEERQKIQMYYQFSNMIGTKDNMFEEKSSVNFEDESKDLIDDDF